MDLKQMKIRNHILAIIRITNNNLINMQNRMDAKKKGVNSIILQSEAINIFKPNMIQVLKHVYSSDEINRIKARITFVIKLNYDSPVIDEVHISWNNREYEHHASLLIQKQISEAFASITGEEINQEAISALTGPKVVPFLTEQPTLTLSDINFDSITNIKF